MKNKKYYFTIVFILILSLFSINYYLQDHNSLELKEEIIKNENSSIAVYIENDTDYERVDSIPDSGYVFNSEKSYCNESEVKNDNIKINYNVSTKQINIIPVKKEKTKCYMYFDKDNAKAREYILSQNTVNSGTPDFSKIATTNEGIFTAQDDDGTSYYYRGAVHNNYFYFGGYYWRIVRINGDGTLRLIYQGKSATSTGTGTEIGISSWNNTYNDNAYIGYMYGTTGSSTYEETHANKNSTTIKGIVDNWYTNNLADYSEYLSDSGLCGDRSIASGTGIGTNITTYMAHNRLSDNKPSLKCTNNNDFYTTASSNKGNKALTNPIGLISADEVVFAGGVTTGSGGTANNQFYLYTGSIWRTMTPQSFSSWNNINYAKVFGMDASGVLRWIQGTNGEYGVRPVINIKKDVDLEGTGTSIDPYKIKGTEINVESAKETILANVTLKTTTPDFSKVATTDEGVFQTEDGMYGGTSYYWRGAVTNNYVRFAGFCWRIVRINGDGSIRLIYDGATCHANGTKTNENIAVLNVPYNDKFTASYYVGWSYDETQHGNTTPSNARTQIESWYSTNLASYDGKIANGKFCNNRNVRSGGKWSAKGDTFYYAASTSLFSKTPTLSCTNASDVFTTKIGLITADEVIFAGSVDEIDNKSYYLYNGQWYWTMSPYMWNNYTSSAILFAVDPAGWNLITETKNTTPGLRPVINLKANTSFSSGNGTISTPYVVS